MIKYIITSVVRTGHTGRTKVGLERPQSRMVCISICLSPPLALTVLSLRISTAEGPVQFRHHLWMQPITLGSERPLSQLTLHRGRTDHRQKGATLLLWIGSHPTFVTYWTLLEISYKYGPVWIPFERSYLDWSAEEFGGKRPKTPACCYRDVWTPSFALKVTITCTVCISLSGHWFPLTAILKSESGSLPTRLQVFHCPKTSMPQLLFKKIIFLSYITSWPQLPPPSLPPLPQIHSFFILLQKNINQTWHKKLQED